jgi:transcriptional regulator GlxA family with amidase domain
VDTIVTYTAVLDVRDGTVWRDRHGPTVTLPHPPVLNVVAGWLAFRLACDFLGDHPERNVGLDELAAAAGIGKFRLIRVFRERTGLPPHALHVAHRSRAARHLLEAGQTIAATATGFADQSHLHRHFQRGLGLTPGEYQRRFTARVEASMSYPTLGTPS